MSALVNVRIACSFNDAYAPHFATVAASLAASRGAEALHVTLIVGPGLGLDQIHTLENYWGTLNFELRVHAPSVDLELCRGPHPSSSSLPSCCWLYS